MVRTLVAFAVVAALSLSMAACKEKTTSEKVGDATKQAGKDIGDAAKDAGKAVEKGAKDAGKAVDDAVKK